MDAETHQDVCVGGTGAVLKVILLEAVVVATTVTATTSAQRNRL